MNIKDQILKSNDRKRKPVATPEWECGTVHVQTLSHTERRELFKKRDTDPDLHVARIAVAVICDEKGTRIFIDDDAPALAAKSSAVLDRIAAAWADLSTLKPEEVTALEKNS